MKTRITVTIEEDLKQRVSASALADRRDVSSEICVLLEEALYDRLMKNGAPSEGDAAARRAAR